MTKTEDGWWEVTVPADQIEPGFHYHDVYVDGVKTLNPREPIGYGASHFANYCDTPDPENTFYLLKDVPHGSVRMELYHSDLCNMTRNCWDIDPYRRKNRRKSGSSLKLKKCPNAEKKRSLMLLLLFLLQRASLYLLMNLPLLRYVRPHRRGRSIQEHRVLRRAGDGMRSLYRQQVPHSHGQKSPRGRRAFLRSGPLISGCVQIS